MTTGVSVPPARSAKAWSRGEALAALLRGRITVTGPTTAAALGAPLALDEAETTTALIALESEGVVLRGSFAGPPGSLEWCDRSLLARIHRYTIGRLRGEIEPVPPADFMRFLFAWQHLDPAAKLTGLEGLRAVLSQLDGVELPAGAWERTILPARLDRYEPSMLDLLCLTGEVGWARLSPTAATPADGQAAPPLRPADQVRHRDRPPVRRPRQRERVAAAAPAADRVVPRLLSTTPLALFLREHAGWWLTVCGREPARPSGRGERPAGLNPAASRVLDVLDARGASFSRELAAACGVDDDVIHQGLAELVAAGLVTSDGFAGVRGLMHTAREMPGARAASAGRWARVDDPPPDSREAAIEAQAWSLLRRYGIVFRRLLGRESTAAAWRELAAVYRRLEARGDIRGGRFVAGMSGEQYALPDAVERLREVRRGGAADRILVISAADPLNLVGFVTAGDRVRAAERHRIAYRDGVPIAALEGEFIKPIAAGDQPIPADVVTALTGRRLPAIARGFVGRAV
jgi:ATP-dependent Lhr-like helicase